jgi:uncharacterized integral membrane protein
MHAGPTPTTSSRAPEHTGTHQHTTAHEDTGAHHDERTHAHEEAIREERAHREGAARDKFGGLNWGACFFGWLVAIALSILLTSIVGAIAAAVGEESNLTWSEADREAGTIGIAAAIVLLAVLLIGYYAGGYVAGRMSRFDGGRQGVGVWAIGLIVTIIAIILGAVFGSQYNILDRVQLPSLPLSGDELGLGAIITAAAIVLGTLLAAMAGGKMGHRYHNRVDRIVRH